jgi:hypothetical protein
MSLFKSNYARIERLSNNSQLLRCPKAREPYLAFLVTAVVVLVVVLAAPIVVIAPAVAAVAVPPEAGRTRAQNNRL